MSARTVQGYAPLIVPAGIFLVCTMRFALQTLTFIVILFDLGALLTVYRIVTQDFKRYFNGQIDAAQRIPALTGPDTRSPSSLTSSQAWIFSCPPLARPE